MRIFACVVGLALLWSMSCTRMDSERLSIAVAANMQFAAKELVEAFEAEQSIPCELVISSSGKLTAQISEGAPFDLFLSANMKYPQKLYRDSLTLGPPRIYAYGRLVLWTLQEGLEPNMALLTSANIRHIALANPQNAPYGEAAVSVLQNYNLLDSLDKKLVYGESIAQTNQFIVSRAADLGFTAMSVVLSPRMEARGQWLLLPDSLHNPITQGAVVLKTSPEKQDMAAAFVTFLLSPAGVAILEKYGYTVSE